jgi:hypothetical protein
VTKQSRVKRTFPAGRPYTRRGVIGNLVLLFAMALSVAVILASVLIVIAARRVGPLQRARQQAIAALCAQRGLVPGVGSGDFAILGRIDPRFLTNAFSSSDQGLAVADFVLPAGKNTQFFTLLSFTVAGLSVPDMSVTLRSFMGPVLGGPPTVELESDEFEKRFIVKAEDRRSAVMLLDPGMMQLVLDCDRVSFYMIGDKVLAFVNRAAEPRHQATEPVEFEILFRFWDGFGPRMPALMRSEYAAQA